MINLTSIKFQKEPFKFFYGSSNLSKKELISILKWLEDFQDWRYTETDFYQQYEFSIIKELEQTNNVPNYIKDIFSNYNLQLLFNQIETIFSEKFHKDKIDIVAHKLEANQEIGLHNDFLEDAETHRLLLQLNPHWKDEDGGILVFVDAEKEEILEAFLPTIGTIQGFEISKNSHHLVSKIDNRERYTIVFSFYKI
jgi:Rps23 Pro-64 3,4-dihydroxylase Tpa1-like proline 4-hydroxylase